MIASSLRLYGISPDPHMLGKKQAKQNNNLTICGRDRFQHCGRIRKSHVKLVKQEELVAELAKWKQLIKQY